MAVETGSSKPRDAAPASSIERVVLTPTMSLADAEMVQYQGKYKGSMADLLRTREINAADLLWELNNAYRADAREAARTLLIYHLGKPEVIEASRRYGPHVYGHSDHLEDKQNDKLFDALIYAFVGVSAVVAVLVWLVTGAVNLLVAGTPWITVMLALAILLLPFAAVAWWFNRRVRNNLEEFRHYRSGRAGEEIVLEALRANLDNRWTIFRSVMIPGTNKQGNNGDTDLIVVGPGGVWALEVKSNKTPLRVANGTWQYMKAKTWRSLRSDPAVQAKRNASALNDYLKKHGITKLWVEPVVILTSPQIVTNFVGSSTGLWFHYNITSKVNDLNNGVIVANTPLADAAYDRVTSILRDLAAKSGTA